MLTLHELRMTVGTSLGIRQTPGYTERAKDDRRYFLGRRQTLAYTKGLRMTVGTSLGLRQTLSYTLRAKDDRGYFSWTQADPSFHYKG